MDVPSSYMFFLLHILLLRSAKDTHLNPQNCSALTCSREPEIAHVEHIPTMTTFLLDAQYDTRNVPTLLSPITFQDSLRSLAYGLSPKGPCVFSRNLNQGLFSLSSLGSFNPIVAILLSPYMAGFVCVTQKLTH